MNIIFTVIIGTIAGIIDILPMIRMKQGKSSIVSAFIFYFFMPFIIFNTNLFGMTWWLKGAVITLVLALPVLLIAAKEDRKSAVPIMVMSILLGTLMGVAGHILIIDSNI